MNFYSPMSFLFLIGLIPIVMMYLLKKQHTEIEVSSNFLWEKAIRDIEANKPWQRLRKNLLLFLQLIIFTLIVLALTQPFILSDMLSGGNLIVVIDTSASMQSTDIGNSRFDKAKNEINDMLNNLRRETKVTLISMGAKPKVILSSSNEKTILKRKLKEIKATHSSDNVQETLSLIRAMIEDMDNYQVVFYTDKDIDVGDMDRIIVKKINGYGDNLAITNISYAFDGDTGAVLTSVKNYSSKEYQGDLILYNDSEIFDVKELSILPNEEKNVYWYGIPRSINILKAELDIDDSLDADNVRYLIVSSSEINKALLVTKGNVFLEKALSLNQGLDLYKSNEILEDISGYDLYIFDGLLPEKLPKDGNLVIINPPQNEAVEVQDVTDKGELRLIDDELFEYVNLDFILSKTKGFVNNDWAEAVLLLNNDPIIIKGEKENQKIVAVAFDFHDTDLPLKIDFPIFIQNVLDYTLNLNGQDDYSILAGEYMDIEALPKTTEVFVVNPEGSREQMGPPFPIAPYIDTDEVGVYSIEQVYNNDTIKNFFVVNVDTNKESGQIISNKDLNGDIELQGSTTKASRSLRDLLLWLGIIIMLLEWVVYNREY